MPALSDGSRQQINCFVWKSITVKKRFKLKIFHLALLQRIIYNQEMHAESQNPKHWTTKTTTLTFQQASQGDRARDTMPDIMRRSGVEGEWHCLYSLCLFFTTVLIMDCPSETVSHISAIRRRVYVSLPSFTDT